MQPPEIREKKWISPIWILPIIALLIGGWLLYKGIKDAGVDIVVHFKSGEGVIVGKTQVIYKGIPVGIVRGMDIDPDLKGVALKIEIVKSGQENLVEDVKFWIVKPEISMGRISGLNTLLSGSYIAVQKGLSKVPAREFIGLEEPPGLPEDAPGLHFKLKSDVLGSIQRGTGIYYKNIVIGEVQRYHLTGDQGVEIDVHVAPEYTHLVQTGTRFWNSSGITLKGGLSGFKVRVGSAASLLYGGISMYTPKPMMDTPRVSNGHVFHLYKDYDAAGYGIKMTLRLPSVAGLSKESSKVIYRGFEVGVVTDFTLNTDDPKRSVTAHILSDPEVEWILRENTRFWIVEPQLSVNKIENLDAFIKASNISFKPGTGEFRDDFIAVEQPQESGVIKPGNFFRLVSENSKSFSLGAPVTYRNIQVGEIVSYDLTADGEHVEAKILIYEKYLKLVRQDSVFWKERGIRFHAGLDGIRVETGTMTSLIKGGIVFENPSGEIKKKMVAEPNTSFTLYKNFYDATEAIPALRPKGLNVHVRTQSSRSFSTGSPVLYKHVEVGEIKGVRLAENGDDIILNVFIQEKYAHLLKTTSKFYNDSGITMEGGLSGLKLKTGSMNSILQGGISFFTPVKGKSAGEKTVFTLYEDYQSALDEGKTEIVLHFTKPKGLTKDMDITYHGVPVGKVVEVKYGPDLRRVEVKALINQGMERLFRSDSLAWLVTAEFSLAGIKNLDTLVKGDRIAVLPGVGEPVLELEALDGPPAVTDYISSGLKLVLETPALGSVKADDPVYYRQFQVGRVTGSALSPTAREVYIFIHIEEPYVALIHENTVFWNVSGIRVAGGLFSGLHVNTESIESILVGGIAFATPEGEAMGAPVEPDHHFILHEKMNKSWLAWKPDIELVKQ